LGDKFLLLGRISLKIPLSHLHHDFKRSRGFLFIGTEGSLIAENSNIMFSEPISFNELPQAMAYLIQKVERLESMLSKTNLEQPDSDKWFNVQELCEFLPDKPARQTVYGWIGQRLIPYHKKGKKLQFLKSEIDAWLLGDKRQSVAELQAEAAEFVAKKGRIVR